LTRRMVDRMDGWQGVERFTRRLGGQAVGRAVDKVVGWEGG
jgi:hypothetical protein